MSEPDAHVLVCTPTSELLEGDEEPGSVRRWCSVCADEVWVSLDGQRFIEREPKVKVMCNECAYGALAAAGEYRVLPVPGSQRQPFERPMMREFRRRVERRRERDDRG
jgi:hypothetical protein